MIIGKIKKNQEKIKFHLQINCINCGKNVPGGIQASKNYFGTKLFKLEISKFKKTYLCGKCRDLKRTKNLRDSF